MNTILLLAADPEVHQGFQLQLEKFHLQVLSAYDLPSARQQLETMTPALLLVDLDQLAESFVSFYDWLQSNPRLQHMSRLYISGRESSESEIVRILSAQSSALVLRKPLQRVRFLNAITDLLKRQTQSFGEGEGKGESEVFASLDTESMPPANPSMPSVGLDTMLTNKWLGRQVGSVMLQREIGRGGMGAVYLGFQSTLNRKVAVKMILPELINNPTMMARFQREALAMARLKSANIVQVYDAGYTDDGTFFMIMEFLEGQDLEEILRQRGPFDVAAVLSIIDQVLEGLVVAHDADIIHRDLKPSNLIMNTNGHTTVTDFGLAQQLTDLRFTREGAMLGTPYYFAPEQANGEGSDARSDIYSLGIVLYELLVGEVPFPSSQLTEVLYQHAHKPMPDPRKRVPSIPRLVVDLLEQMTAKRPDHRFSDARTALRAVREARRYTQPNSRSLAGSGTREEPMPQPMPQPMSNVSLSHLPAAPPAPQRALSGSLQTSHAGLSLPIDPARRLGAFTISSNGSIASKDGAFSAVWSGSLQILQAVLQQLESVSQMGPLNYALCEAEEELLVLMNADQQTEGMIFALQSVPSSIRMSLSHNVTSMPAMTTSIVDPLVHLSSTAGVDGLILLTEQGVLRHHILPSHIDGTAFASRISPLAALFSSLSLPLCGVDCCFERGRTLFWKIEQQYLVVLASHQLNKSLLAILLQQQRELLRAFVPHSGRSIGSLPSGSLPNGSLLSGQRSRSMGQQNLHVSQEDSLMIDDSLPPESSLATSLSASLAASQVAALPPSTKCLTPDEVSAVTKAFARFIGPMAKLLLKQEAKKMGLSTKQLPQDRVATLAEKLGGHLDTEKRQEFLAVIHKMLG